MGDLEKQSVWIKYKSALWMDKYKEQKDNVSKTLDTFRAVRNLKHLIYVSMPITSGKYYYQLLLEHPNIPKEMLGNLSRAHNYIVGLEFMETLKEALAHPIILPADLYYPSWVQEHYQALWLGLIAEKCTEMRMTDGWEYSNGAVEEYTHAVQLGLGIPDYPDLITFASKKDEELQRERMRNIIIYDAHWNVMSVYDGINKINEAIQWLSNNGFKSTIQQECKYKLQWALSRLQEGYYQ